MKGFTHITDDERRRIERALEQGESIRSMANKLHRSASSISDEINRNKTRKKGYDRNSANEKAKIRRKNSKIQCLKVAMDKKLREFVINNIEQDQSPAGISGRIKNIEKDKQYVSLKAIYKFVRSPYGRKIEKHLYSKTVRKKGGPKRGKKKVQIDGRTMIDKRPEEVEKRLEFGHYEGDFIESGKDGKGSLLVLVERKTRYPFLIYTEDKSTKNINNLVADNLKELPIKSFTIDNDLSFQKHEELSKLIQANVFFCHPYCSHEKGTIENRNKAIRRYAPKKSDLSFYDLEYFKEVETKLRNKFMECLNYKTPQEMWNIEIENLKKEKQSDNIIKTKKHADNDVLQTKRGVRIEG